MTKEQMTNSYLQHFAAISQAKILDRYMTQIILTLFLALI